VIHGHPKSVSALIDAKANVNVQTVFQISPLMLAVQSTRGRVEMVTRLIQARADVNARATSGKTALRFARDAGHKDAEQLLLAAGAEPLQGGNDHVISRT
jgi:serine/threonine-protein phosphatase 6 regulatory ankyrin repeat subunit B